MSNEKYFVRPIERSFDVSIHLPGSKSIALRQLVLAALCSGTSELHGVPECDDVDAMLSALQQLNVYTEMDPQGVVYVDGSQLDLSRDVELDLNMSGVSLRLLSALAGLRSGTTRLSGHPSLAARPNQDLLNALQDLGCLTESNDGKLPITIKGPKRTNEVTLRTDVSSQFLSALLLIGPSLPSGLIISLEGNTPSKSYVELTLNEINKRGVETPLWGDTMHIQPGTYKPGTYQIEGDASALSYHAALATLHRSKITIENLGNESIQGDMQFLHICQQLGASVAMDEGSIEISGDSNLQGIDTVDMNGCPDTATTLMAIAPYLPKSTRINGLETLPRKECNRIVCPATELEKAGISVSYGTDYMVVHPGKPKPTTFATYDDHRMAMSFAVLATASEGSWIENPACVGKTYPNFWRDLEGLYGEYN